VIAWVVGRGLRPLAAVARRIESIGDKDLSARVDAEKTPAELRPVVDRLNELLARLEAAFLREKTFTADIAHELRTPLAGLTTALEVCASQQRTPAEYEQVITRCLKVSRTMRAMMENLLMLARVDARQLKAATEAIDLPALLADAWKDFAAIAARRQLRVQWNCPETLAVKSDRGLLAMVLRNLFDNAARYAGDAGFIHIDARFQDRHAVIVVENSDSQVAAGDAQKVFDRFWRGDAARSAAGEHCGLGLALCRRIVDVLGGTIAVATERGGAFRVTVQIPAADPSTNPSAATPQGEVMAAGAA
jgi:signal transduction histidine kinase